MRYIFTILLLISNIFLLSAQSAVYPFADQNNKWGIIDNSKHIILQPTYEHIAFFHNHEEQTAVAIVKDKKLGVINIAGKLILPCIYDKIEFLGDDFITIGINKKTGVAGRQTGKILIQPTYDSISRYEVDEKEKIFFLVHEHNKAIYLDTQGRETEAPQYSGISSIDPGKPMEAKENIRKYAYSLLSKQNDTSHYILSRRDGDNVIFNDTVRLFHCKIDTLLYPDAYHFIIQLSTLATGKKGLATYEPINRKLERALRVRTPLQYDDIKPLYRKDEKNTVLGWLLLKGDLLGFATPQGKEGILPAYVSITDPELKLPQLSSYILVKTLQGNTAYSDIIEGEVYIKE
ncbi:MAG: WG repeat-containing protein [Taibaiella sp.]|jgi:hypothetical protein